MTTNVKRGNTWRMLLVVGVIVLGAGMLFAWSRILFPVLAAFLLADLTHPLALFFEKRRLPRIFGFLIVLLILASLLFVIFFVFLPAVVHELMAIGRRFPLWRKVLAEHVGLILADLEQRYPEAYALLQEHFTQWVQENLPDVAQHLVGWLLKKIVSAITLAATLFNLILIPVIAAYLTVDFHKFISALRRLVPQPVLPTVEQVVVEVHRVLADFLRGQLLLAVALGVLYTIGMLIVRAPLALVIGPLSGLAALIPYLGFVFGVGTGALLALFEYRDLWHPVAVLVAFLVAQNIEGWFLTPLLLGRKIGLHPAWVLVALLLGGELFGIPGIVVAVPVAAALQVILRHALQAYRVSSVYLGTATEIVFYTRQGCRPCEEFELLLESILKPGDSSFHRVDVDSSPELAKVFGSRVPVLEVNGIVVAEGRIPHKELEQRVERALRGQT